MAGSIAVDARAGAAVVEALPVARAAVVWIGALAAANTALALGHAITGAVVIAAAPLTAATVESGAALTVETLGAANDSRAGTRMVGASPRPGATGRGSAAFAVGVADAVAVDAGAGTGVVDALPAWSAAISCLAAARLAVIAGAVALETITGAFEVGAPPLASAAVIGQAALAAGRGRAAAAAGAFVRPVGQRVVAGVKATVAALRRAGVNRRIGVVTIVASDVAVAVSVANAADAGSTLTDITGVGADDVHTQVALDAGATIADCTLWALDRGTGVVGADAGTTNAKPTARATLWAEVLAAVRRTAVIGRLGAESAPAAREGKEQQRERKCLAKLHDFSLEFIKITLYPMFSKATSGSVFD